MEPPVNRHTYSGSAKKQGASIRKTGTLITVPWDSLALCPRLHWDHRDPHFPRVEAELDPFGRLRHPCRCRGARHVRAENIPVEPVWVMPAEGADERVSAKSTRAVFRDYLRLRRDAGGFYPPILSRLEYLV